MESENRMRGRKERGEQREGGRWREGEMEREMGWRDRAEAAAAAAG